MNVEALKSARDHHRRMQTIYTYGSCENAVFHKECADALDALFSRQSEEVSEEEWERAWEVFNDPQSGQNSRTRMTDEMYSVLSDFVVRRATIRHLTEQNEQRDSHE